jgi:hypothetical protein
MKLPSFTTIITILLVVALAEALGIMDKIRTLFSGLKK